VKREGRRWVGALCKGTGGETSLKSLDFVKAYPLLELHLSSGSFMILRLKERVSSSVARRDQLEEFRFRQGLSLARTSSILWLFHDPAIERACLVLGVHEGRERVRDQLEEFRCRRARTSSIHLALS
jgi:hypothetical protein